jgi:putative endonuclease
MERRLFEHRNKLTGGFTSQYNCDKLVYFEISESVESAIEREKQLKRWHRGWKLNLIRENNFHLHDLSRELFGQEALKQVQGDN